MQNKANTPLITDQLLAELAAPNAQASVGEWDAQTRALLAVAIPEMAAELQKRRLVDAIKSERVAEFSAIRSRQRRDETNIQSLNRARKIVRAAPPIHPHTLTIACRTILQLSTDAAERRAAADILSQMNGDAA